MARHFLLFIVFASSFECWAQEKTSGFKVLVLSEDKGHHVLYSKEAKKWLNQLAKDSSFVITYLQNTDTIDDFFLSQYQLLIQLDYPPYGWTDKSAKAFQKSIEQGTIGWIGFHHATLLGEFDGFPMWNWFSDFMGGIRYENYIATFVKGTVNVEAKNHPCMKGVPSSFVIHKEEWYTYNTSPRTNVHVLASVDESTYMPETKIKMGDHPVVWSNEKMASRNIYIFMGHSPDLFKNNAYTTLFKNSIFWAAQKQ
jgi:type 1 glutamine amidotransferase